MVKLGGKTILIAGHFAQCWAVNETPKAIQGTVIKLSLLLC